MIMIKNSSYIKLGFEFHEKNNNAYFFEAYIAEFLSNYSFV